MEALIIQADGFGIRGWDELCRASERVSLRLRIEHGISASLARVDPGLTDAVILLLEDGSISIREQGGRVAELARALPVLVLSAADDPLGAEALLGLGVQDILPLQTLEGSLLAPLVRNAVERFRNASALRLSTKVLGILADSSPLDQKIEATAVALGQHLACSAAGIRLMDRHGRLPMAASVGYAESFAELVMEPCLARDDEACAAVALGRHPGGLFALRSSPGGGGYFDTQSMRTLPCLGHEIGPRHPCAQSSSGLLCVFPIQHGTQIQGILQLRFDSARGIGAALLATLESFGLQLGAAIDHASSIAAGELRERRLRTLISAISSAVFSLDAKGDMSEPQPEWNAYTGQVFDPMSPHAWVEQVHPDERAKVEQLFLSDSATEGLREMEVRIGHSPSGQHRSCLLRAVPRRAEDGRHLEWIVALTDIQAEREASRNREALESQLRQAQRLEAVGRLAGGVAHDFNNLLTIIQGNLYLLEAEPRAEGAWPEELMEIGAAAARASDLTRQLLAFSRCQLVQSELLDLNAIITNLEKMLRRVIREDICLCIEMAQGLYPVMADPGQMEQLLLNLALHAREAMPMGGTLTIGTANTELGSSWVPSSLVSSPGPHVLLSVSDSGQGLDEDTRSRIFEPYPKPSPMSPQRSLGLAAVYGIVKQHGGHILVKSTEGVGTTFEIFLPAASPVAAQTTSTVALSHRREEPRERQTVLVVEDEAPVRQLVVRILKHYGYRVLVASGAAEALARSRDFDGEIDLVLSDVVMPKMYGPEIVSALRLQRPHVPVLYMSGYADSVVLYEAQLGRGTAFIEKPFAPEDLAESIRRVIEESSIAGGSRGPATTRPG